MGVLNRTPEGFLDLTGQRVGGRYPTQLSDVVAPTVDLSYLLKGRLTAVETAASLTSNVGDQVTIDVPDNENWLLFNLGTQYITTANNDRVWIGIYVDELPGSSDPANKMLIHANEPAVGINNVHTFYSASSIEPMLLTPGTQIVGECLDESSGGTLGWSIHCGLVKFVGN